MYVDVPQIERLSDLLAKQFPRATIDFETRSAADIRQGAWMYSKHPSTRVLCLCFTLPGQDPDDPSIWMAPMDGHEAECDSLNYFPLDRDGKPYNVERLFEYIRAGGMVEAHNVGFERAIWTHIFTRPTGWDENGVTGWDAPHLRDTQLYDSAAKTSAFALPRSLGAAGQALGLSTVKDEEGKRLMLKLSKPRKARKGEPHYDGAGEPIIYYHDWSLEDFDTLCRYCADDVRAEHALSTALPDLTDFEYKVWLADLRANWKGVRIDVDLVHAAIDLDRMAKEKMNEELWSITGVERGTLRAQVMAWINEKGGLDDVGLPGLYDTAAPTLDWLMARPEFSKLKEDVQRVIYIARNINRTSVTKYKRILLCMDPDDHRVRELVLYHGAATGRWSGKGIQVQNFPRGNLMDLVNSKEHLKRRETTVKATMEMAVRDVKTRNLAWCEWIYGDVLSLISSTLRGALIPGLGKVFYVADYSAIEARVVLWLADAPEALEVFRRGEDIYCAMASKIYRRTITKKDNPDERQFGKVVILGLGYGMGFLTFLLNLRSYDLRFTVDQVKDILGDSYAKYDSWIRARLWPKPPVQTDFKSDAKYAEAVKKFRSRSRQAAADRRRLIEAREVPEDILHELALCKFVVDTYRETYPEVKQLWYDQEDAAVEAVRLWQQSKNAIAAELAEDCERIWGEDIPEMYEAELQERLLALGPAHPVQCGKVTWVVDTRYLFCILPSGRRLVYADPILKAEKTPWGEVRHEMRFMGVHKKFKRWERMATYGGSIVENIDQATARDMMAYALVTMDESEDYEPIASIHDELLSEADEGTGDDKEYEALMITLPAWADGCPVASEGGTLTRYQK